MKHDLIIVGSGPMAVEYARVLQALNVDFGVIGRGQASADKFTEITGVPVITGGLDSWLNTVNYVPSKAIVCVTENQLGEVSRRLIQKGVKTILVEKPGGLDSQDIKNVAAESVRHGATTYVGYNRRFYASVRKAQEYIQADGGVTSFHFEFTEWSHVIAGLEKAPGVKEQWFLANSSHVIDLAFYLGGNPREICCFTTGGLDWHPSASIYAGAGRTGGGALFSYCANWEAPGRWSLEVLTKKHRLIFRPMEKLQIQKIGSVAIEEVPLDDELDTSFKPGIYRQTEAFLNADNSLISISDQVAMLQYYEKICGDNSCCD